MPNLAAAKKALRVSKRKNSINKRVKDEFKSARKLVMDNLTSGDVDSAKKNLSKAYSKIDAASKKGVLHDNTASRYKSRLSNQVKKADSK
jgi:small subunit ribosomal protein S20